MATSRRPRKQRVTDVVLFAPVGSNPAHVVALSWALWKHERLRVRAAHLVLFERGQQWLRQEMLGPKGALAALHNVVGAEVLPQRGLHHEVPRSSRGEAVADDAEPEDAIAFLDGVVRGARAAIVEAGDRPVVFGLVGGSRRTLTAAATVVAQFFARPKDLVIDVRYDPRGAGELPNQFFFPAQRDQQVLGLVGHGGVRPADVDVRPVTVPIPRIHELVKDRLVTSYAELLAVGQQAIDAAGAPTLMLDFGLAPSARLVWSSGIRAAEPLNLPLPMLLHLGALALAQERGDLWLRPVKIGDDANTHPFVELIQKCELVDSSVRHETVQHFRNPKRSSLTAGKIATSMETLRSRTNTRLKQIERELKLGAGVLAPEMTTKGVNGRRSGMQRLRVRAQIRMAPQAPGERRRGTA